MPAFTGVHHLAVTVSDLDASTAFYTTLFGAEPAAELEGDGLRRRLFALPGGMNLGLTQHDSVTTETFSPFRPGMDHLGFAVETRAELEKWAEHLTRNGIEHAGIVDVSYGSALSLKDPDRIALEFFVGAE